MTEHRGEDGGARGNCTLLRCQWCDQRRRCGAGPRTRRRRQRSISEHLGTLTERRLGILGKIAKDKSWQANQENSIR